jgi:RNA methyltransferase, TrmH family
LNLITSNSNQKIKQVRALRQRKARQESGLFLVEGIHPVGEAAAAAAAGRRITIETILYAPERLTSEFALGLVEEQSQGGVPCYPATPEVFESISEKENPQGILAVVRLAQPELDELNPANFPWGVALLSPQDPGNVGTILRTIDAVGASGLLLVNDVESGRFSCDPYHPAAVRASMGTLFWYPVLTVPLLQFAGWINTHAYHLYGTSSHAVEDYKAARGYPRPAVLLLGSEQAGLAPQHIDLCERLVRLPMYGRASSLNLAVAAGIMLYAMIDSDN